MSNVVEIARSYIGNVKYVFGAQDPDNGKSDCSGFTMTVFKKAGYNIPRTTGGVWDSNYQNVSKENLQAGDLVLFKNTYDSGYTDGVSHIGIYSGNGMFIHCGSDGVREEKLNTTYWNNHYLGAKRVDELGITSEENTNVSNKTLSQKLGLNWWGDIVVAVLSILLVLGGIALLVLGVKGSVIDKVLRR